jgi:hypothetical protein
LSKSKCGSSSYKHSLAALSICAIIEMLALMLARRRIGSLCFPVLIVAAQLPPSATLSDDDRAQMRVLDHLEKLLPAAPDRNTVTCEIARTWAAGKQWPEAIEWLDKVGALKSGLDPSRDSIFIELRGSREFAAMMEAARDAAPPFLHSTPAFQVAEGDLIPESLAYDPKTKAALFGQHEKSKILRCTAQGACATFAEGLGQVLGLKIDARGLWLLNNPNESALIRYDLSLGGLHK